MTDLEQKLTRKIIALKTQIRWLRGYRPKKKFVQYAQGFELPWAARPRAERLQALAVNNERLNGAQQAAPPIDPPPMAGHHWNRILGR